MPLSGHLWTLGGYLRRRRIEAEPPTGEPWSTELSDPAAGRLVLSGRLVRQGDPLLMIVHGLGGCADSGYVRLAALEAARAGLASLSLNLRGADRKGGDYHHAALTTDLAAAVASPELAAYSRVFILGFSMGGHLGLRYGTESPDERLAAVAAVCPPLDLSACCDHIDRPAAGLYRRYILARLLEIYAEVAARRDVPVPVAEARRIRRQRDFDDRIVAPRHGFDGVDDYYSRASVGPRLKQLRVPALIVAAQDDPLVPAASLRPFLEPPPAGVAVRWVRGGHVGFPTGLDLGEPGPKGLEAQVVSWLLRSQG